MSTLTFDRASGRKLGRKWGWVFLSGILFIIIGFVAVSQPFATGIAVGIMLGLTLLTGGVTAMAAGFANLHERGAWLYAVIGLLAFLVGLKTLFFPAAGAVSLVWVMGLWLLVGGVVEVGSGFTIEKGGISLIALGIINVVLGGILLAVDPVLALRYLAIVVGVSFFVRGIGSMMFAMFLRRLSNR
jgi:uncharacterized membrane protein HdeD (DUF308 family)